MDPLVLLGHLQRQRPAGLPPGELAVQPVQENVFRLRAGRQHFLVKWIAANNRLGQNELRVGRTFSRLKIMPAPSLVFEHGIEGGTIAGWEWIDGHDLRTRDRERLPDFFARLGELHAALRNNSEVISPISGESFYTVAVMVAVETARMCTLINPALQDRFVLVLSRLEAGYPTLIHGDMHPGNMIFSRQGLWFVDWSFARNSLNLLDLDYVLSTALAASGPAWSVITPAEAERALPAYFEAAGLAHLDPLATHQAVMVWTLLWEYQNSVTNAYRVEQARTLEQLQTLLANIQLG